MANQINSFLETVCKPIFQRNLFNQALLKSYVLEEEIQKPDIPTYCEGDFFPTIKRINSSPLSLSTIGVREIYRFLLVETNLQKPETGNHTYFTCQESQASIRALLLGLRKFIPTLSPSNILALDFDADKQYHFPLVWFSVTFLFRLWNLCCEKKKVELIKIQSKMEPQCRLLRESRLTSTLAMIAQIF
jgi:hypothetical protein